MRKTMIILTVFVSMLFAIPSVARVKLVTLPVRDRLLINLDHPTFNLVMEERVVTLLSGVNKIDFSWQGVAIDPASIQFQILSHPDTVKMLNVSYPPNENALVWEVSAPEATEERIRIYYLMSGLNREISYRAVVEKDEKNAILESYFKLINQSGENLTQADIAVGYGASWTKDIQNGESLQMLSYAVPALPVKKLYVYKPAEDISKVAMYYEINNDSESGLGTFKMLGGKARIFQRDSSGATIFVGEDWMKDTPVKEKSELFLGVARDVSVKRNVMSDERQNIRRNNSKKIVLSDRVINVKYEIQNFKKEPLTLKIVEKIGDYWELEELSPAAVRSERKDAGTLEILVDLPPEGSKQIVSLVYRMKNQLE
jgi:hypothetical protein